MIIKKKIGLQVLLFSSFPFQLISIHIEFFSNKFNCIFNAFVTVSTKRIESVYCSLLENAFFLGFRPQFEVSKCPSFYNLKGF